MQEHVTNDKFGHLKRRTTKSINFMNGGNSGEKSLNLDYMLQLPK